MVDVVDQSSFEAGDVEVVFNVVVPLVCDDDLADFDAMTMLTSILL